MPGQYFGKYTGIVKDNSDDQNLGQLQVSVPAIFPPDDVVAARAALPYGYFFVPENNAKVWVEFEGGEPGLPLWTGVQYVSGEWPDEAKANPPQLRVIKTAAGHLIIFDDKDGEAGIEIKDGVNGHDIKLNQDGISVVDGKNNHKIDLTNQGISVKDGVNNHEIDLTNQGISVKDGVNQNSLTLDASGVKVDAGTGAKVELAATGVTVDSGLGAKVELTAAGVNVDGGPAIVSVTGSVIKLSQSAALPIIRITDQGIGNLGAPVVLIGPGNPTVLA